ncbi:MAG: phosphoribosylformylglycinamidine synthase [Treponema sp.]|nr:phosphoribosylformylglycinamidine synthase [Treponema sp.]
MSVYEIYVEKKPEYAQEAASVLSDLRLGLQLDKITGVRIANRYFAEDISEIDFNSVRNTVFSEPPVDITYDKFPDFNNARVFAVEYLPGQYDQRADSCAQCISLTTGKDRPRIHSSKIYALYGDFSDDEYTRIKSWLLNPVESREASLEKPQTLVSRLTEPDDIGFIDGFINLSQSGLEDLRARLNLAMDSSDLKFCQDYFRSDEKRDPSVTEIRVLDTYWSDHCRHTTFLTELNEIQIDDEIIQESYQNYLRLRASLGRNGKPVTLMDIATTGAAALKQKGLLPNLDESEEINACSVKIKVDIQPYAQTAGSNGDGSLSDSGSKEQDWLLMFKNETHNHPTEIEPFGGAATCLGGAIRDPLSGRAFVYQAMRITGAGDPLQSVSDTLPGKLPQRKICRTAAAGYSSYGNQIGLSTGLVHEIYHPGYAAKRMEIGVVIGAAPAETVIRKTPSPGDAVILLGGRTGRDGIGGATGSSKTHTLLSLETCGADVQKGNAPEERKLQRLFRDPAVTQLIKRCNDFGAGGISVSVGELADGLLIDLDKVPKKYEGLDGTELAISESQERMSVVTAKENIGAFIKLAADENLEATVIADVTDDKRLVMKWRGKTIVNLARDFLDSSGSARCAKVHVKENGELRKQIGNQMTIFNNDNDLADFIGSLNMCSQKGLAERFDSCIGAASVAAPFGGKYQLTPVQAMTAKIPVLKGETKTCSVLSWGFDPEISSLSPYHGAVFAVVHSVAKIIASGGSRKNTYLTFQEYFEKLGGDPSRWGKPFQALLGALDAQMGLQVAAIGGKDSMSGSFETSSLSINVPPTLVSFAVSASKTGNIITPEFKKTDSKVYLLKPPFSLNEKQDYSALCRFFNTVEDLISSGRILSAWAMGSGGTAEAILKMCFGSRIGFETEKELSAEKGFGGFIVEVNNEELMKNDTVDFEYFGKTTDKYLLITKSIEMLYYQLQFAWESKLEGVYPYMIKHDSKTETFNYLKKENTDIKRQIKASLQSKPKFLIPVFPGTNSEYDSAKAVEKVGGLSQIFVIRNLSSADIAQSVTGFEKELNGAQILFIPGGFSGGDEPDGSGKFITAFLRNQIISDAIAEMLQKRDGLILGICNGFQALIKLGLIPYGEIRDMTDSSPTLTFNAIGRHQSTLVNTRIVSNKSPWLSHLEQGEQYIVPISHGEGRFIADEKLTRALAANGQIATQYADFDGNASQDIRFNPNNSNFAVEGITSPDGRIFGRMAHNERFDDGLYKNIPGIRKMDIFSGAVNYFK